MVAHLGSLCPLGGKKNQNSFFFFGKIDYRMFMHLMWTISNLNVTNLSDCCNLNEV